MKPRITLAILLAAIFAKHFGHEFIVAVPDGIVTPEIAYARSSWQYVMAYGADAVLALLAAWHVHQMAYAVVCRLIVLGALYMAFEDAQCAACGMADVVPGQWSGMCLAAYGPSPYLLFGAAGLIYLGWASRVRTDK